MRRLRRESTRHLRACTVQGLRSADRESRDIGRQHPARVFRCESRAFDRQVPRSFPGESRAFDRQVPRSFAGEPRAFDR
jgi:hypothetical protein